MQSVQKTVVDPAKRESCFAFTTCMFTSTYKLYTRLLRPDADTQSPSIPRCFFVWRRCKNIDFRTCQVNVARPEASYDIILACRYSEVLVTGQVWRGCIARFETRSAYAAAFMASTLLRVGRVDVDVPLTGMPVRPDQQHNWSALAFDKLHCGCCACTLHSPSYM